MIKSYKNTKYLKVFKKYRKRLKKYLKVSKKYRKSIEKVLKSIETNLRNKIFNYIICRIIVIIVII